MKKRTCVELLALLFLLAAAIGCGKDASHTSDVNDAGGTVDAGTNADSGFTFPDIPANDLPSPNESSAEPWTFIFYLAADNEQEAYADATIDQLLEGTAAVENHPQIIALVDRLSVPGTEIFEVVNGTKITLQTLSEQNTADATVLEDFLNFALGLADPDNNVAFVMKSEGLSWRGIGRDNTHGEELEDQLMPTGAMAEALAGKGIDLLVLEGAIMAFMEVVYELRGAALMMLATQSKIQPDGFPWKMVIEDLGETPAMTNRELGIRIVDDHITYYNSAGNRGDPNNDPSIDFAALTLFDLAYIYEARDTHMAWAQITWSLLDEVHNILPHARDLSDVGGWGDVTEVDFQSDIRTFMYEGLRLIYEAGLDFPDLTSAVYDYLVAQNKLVVYMRKPEDGFKMRSANGLSIWFPPTSNKYETYDESDEVFGTNMFYEDPLIGLDWVSDSNWLEFLFNWFDRGIGV